MPDTQGEAPSDQLKPGQYIGNYRVVRHIGEGGMGVVFEALHEEIGRRVAIKVLRRDISNNPDIARRFINEARVVTQIQHSGLVQVFDYGRLPDNSAYIVMEFLQGRQLTDRIRNAAAGMPVADVVRFGRQLAGALTVTHEMGITHRDLKPENVMLIADREIVGGERAKILDFGIAKVSNSAGSRTRTHTILGSAPYMAPEQCRGSGEITDRTDVYSLGVMLFEMLTGRLPFTADEDVELMTKHIKEPPPQVSSVKKDAPPELAGLVDRMLKKAPVERPSMRDVKAAFEAMLPMGASGVLPIVPMVELDRKRQRRLRVLAGVALVSLLSIVILISRRPLLAPGSGSGVATNPASVVPPATASPAVASVASVPARQIRWHIETTPAGADVIQDGSGKLLGKTPWEQALLPGEGTLGVTLRLPGYFKRNLNLRLDSSEQITETLKPITSDSLDLPSVPVRPPSGRGGPKVR